MLLVVCVFDADLWFVLLFVCLIMFSAFCLSCGFDCFVCLGLLVCCLVGL